MTDDPRATAYASAAPSNERADALRQLQRAFMPTASDLLPVGVIEDIQASIDLLKAQRVVPFPVDRARTPAPRGRQSASLDEMQVAVQGDYYDPPAVLSPAMARRMVDQTPILQAIVMTRQRQIARFCQPSEDDGMGFVIRHVDPSHALDPEEEASIRRLTRFFQHCGWEWNPRKRKALGRNNFSTFMMKLVRDSLTLDRNPIEIEEKRDASLGIDGFSAVDGETVRLCVPGEGFRGDDSIYAVQVLNGRIETAYPQGTIIFEPRNPRADVRWGDYGFSELETLVQTVTGFLEAMTLNVSGFTRNSIPKGVLHLMGDYSDEDLLAFKRYLKSMTTGAANAWAMPVMVSKDPQGKAAFEKFGIEFNEMYFGKWMTFLVSLACSIYTIDPSEINFESFTNGHSSLSGGDTTEKLAASKDKGLRPLLSYYETVFTDFIVADFGDKYCFRFAGLDPRDEARLWEGQKLVLTTDELRARENLPPHPMPIIGAAPLNPSLLPLYQQQVQPQGQDFGQGGGDDFGQAPNGEDQDADGQDEDAESDGLPDGGGGGPDGPGEGAPLGPRAPAGPGAGDFGKALPAIYSIGAR